MSGIPGKGRLPGIPNGYPAHERILRRTIVDDNGCWLWQGATDAKTYYGKIGVGYGENKKMLYTHRVIVSWYWLGEEGDFIPKEMFGIKTNLHHECRVRRCVNPEHLYFVAAFGNSRLGGKEANIDKTECPHGHGPYDKQYKNGWRYCSKCKNEKEKRRRAKILAEGKTIKGTKDTCYKGHQYDLFPATGPKCSICRKENRKLYHARTGH